MVTCLRALNVTKSYLVNGKRIKVLSGINLEVECGQLISIVGPSGAGKSTLLNILSTIDTPDKGIVEHLGVRVYPRGEDWRAKWRRAHVGVVLQFIFLIPTLTAYENVLLALEMSKKFRDRAKRAIRMLELVGLSDKADRYPNELSGGEQQRVALARALANDPEIIIADEPLSNLDSDNRRAISRLLRELVDQGKTVIVTTHEEELVRVSDAVCEMRRGALTCH